jgi:DNA-binding SARP family transcriptional activator
MVVHLLGRPEIERDGTVVLSPRGRKAWAVLAYVLLAERPVSRARLAAMLFSDAEDPLGALRWTLAELRRALGLSTVLRGDPLSLILPADAEVDALALGSGDGGADLVRGELLEDCDPGVGGAFDAWLLVERRRLAGVSGGVLREAALESLAMGSALDGAGLASRALSLDPLDEGLHELLVRCLVGAGQIGAARHQATVCELLFQRELGRPPDSRVRRAVDAVDTGGPPAIGDRAAALGQMEAGVAALAAGAAEPGVACLRLACAEARALGDDRVLARALVTLGGALVHSVRGRDEEGAAVLHEALAVGEGVGEREVMVEACRELGYVEVQAGRGAAAGRLLQKATLLAVGDGERAAILGVRGMALSDRAHYGAAIELLRESVAAADRRDDTRQAGWSLALLGRAFLLRDDLAEATAALDRALELVTAAGWVAFAPFPETMRAEVALRHGDLAQARGLLRHAFSLGCRLGDPCWEALAARAMGLVHDARDERGRALECLRDAAARAVRVADPYLWVYAYCLEALAGVALDAGAEDARETVEALERVAARCDMRELVVRAAMHRARMGDSAGIEAVGPLLAAIDNPALQSAVHVG